jgi:hypothetical protein
MTPYTFFYKWAGYSYTPGKETKQQGRANGAKLLARAERMARYHGWTFSWERDTETDASFRDTDNPYYLWVCVARDAHGQVRSSLCGIDFGPDKEPWGDTYARVIEAELACEGLSEKVS